MKDRLIVGFDGSASALSALRWAAREGVARKASISVISSYSMPLMMDAYGLGTASAPAVDLDAVEQASLLSMHKAVDEVLGDHPDLAVDVRAVDAPAASALVEQAREADLVILGASGTGALARILLGSVVAGVLHHSPCPVIVVPEDSRLPQGRIAVGVDGSASADLAVRWAAEEADRLGAELIVAHAWEYPYRLTAEGEARGRDIAEVDAALTVERAVQAARELTVGPIEGRPIEGGAAEALLDLSHVVDLVAVGSRGRGGFRSMLLGSVATALAGHAACPIAVVRGEG